MPIAAIPIPSLPYPSAAPPPNAFPMPQNSRSGSRCAALNRPAPPPDPRPGPLAHQRIIGVGGRQRGRSLGSQLIQLRGGHTLVHACWAWTTHTSAARQPGRVPSSRAGQYEQAGLRKLPKGCATLPNGGAPVVTFWATSTCGRTRGSKSQPLHGWNFEVEYPGKPLVTTAQGSSQVASCTRQARSTRLPSTPPGPIVQL